MTNFEKQKRLNEEKWLVSEAKNQDQSGIMPYCNFCKQQNNGACLVSQKEIEAKRICATAYNRMIRHKVKNGSKI